MSPWVKLSFRHLDFFEDHEGFHDLKIFSSSGHHVATRSLLFGSISTDEKILAEMEISKRELGEINILTELSTREVQILKIFLHTGHLPLDIDRDIFKCLGIDLSPLKLTRVKNDLFAQRSNHWNSNTSSSWATLNDDMEISADMIENHLEQLLDEFDPDDPGIQGSEPSKESPDNEFQTIQKNRKRANKDSRKKLPPPLKKYDCQECRYLKKSGF